MRIPKMITKQAPVEIFARSTYEAFSGTGIAELSKPRLLKRVFIDEVELSSSLKDGKLIIKSFPMYFSYSKKPKEVEIFQALPKNQASRLLFKESEALIEEIEIGAEYAMALTDDWSFAHYRKIRKNNANRWVKI